MKKTIRFRAIISILAILVCFVALLAPQVYAEEVGDSISNPIILANDTYYSKKWTKDNVCYNCYCKIDATSRGYVTFTIVNSDDYYYTSLFRLQLLNISGQVVWSAKTSNYSYHADEIVYKIGLDKGTYYMELEPYFDVIQVYCESKFKYSFTAAENWELEPNGALSNATYISLNKMYKGVYGEDPYDVNPQDKYSVDLVKGNMYSIKINNAEALFYDNALVRILNSYGYTDTVLSLSDQDSEDYSWIFKPTSTDTYYIEIYNESSIKPKEYEIGVYNYVCEHTPSNYASCVEKAVCSKCGEEYGDYDKTNHYVSDYVSGKDATCTETGLTLGEKCRRCGEMKVPQKVIPALGHKEIVIKGYAATCTTNGKTDGKKCTVCGKVTVAQKDIKAKGHKEVTVKGKAATYTAAGLTNGKKCSVCGKVTVAQETIARKKLGKPKKISASATTNSVTLKWSKVTGATAYGVYSYNSSTKKSKLIKKVTALTYKVTGLKDNTTYNYYVVAIVEAGKKSYTSDSKASIKVKTKRANSIVLSETALKLCKGKTATLKAEVYPSDVKVTWKSSDKSVAKVSGGKITAVKKGTATITASFKYKKKTYKATCKVTVSDPSIKLSESKATVFIYDSLKLTATTNPTGVTVKWSTSDKSVAKVSSKGVVTGVKAGKATITASFVYNKKTYTSKCVVTVKKQDPITINYVDWEINTADGVEPEITITNNTNKYIKYIDIYTSYKNRFGDPAYCEIRNSDSRVITVTSGLEAKTADTFYWDPVIYNSSVHRIDIDYVEITFIDNSTTTLEVNKYWYDSYYYN